MPVYFPRCRRASGKSQQFDDGGQLMDWRQTAKWIYILFLGTGFIGPFFPLGARAEIKYTVIDLGTLGGAYSSAAAINAEGQVTGASWAIVGNDVVQHAFVWTPNIPNGTTGTIQDIGTIGTSYSNGNGINASGEVTGGFSANNNGFVYDGSFHELGSLGGTNTIGLGINASGQVVGLSNLTPGALSFSPHAFLWNPAVPNGPSGTIEDLGTLGGAYSQAIGINDRGQITGYANTVGGDGHAFFWTPSMPNGANGTMQDLGTLGGASSTGNSINSEGQVAGYAYTNATVYHAFFYDGAMHDLGTLGGIDSEAESINASGEITGWSYEFPQFPTSNERAFLWTSNSGMVDLNTLIDPQSDWTLDNATALNDAGQIVGYGSISGQPHGFLLTPVPEPSTIVLAVIGAGLAIGYHHKRNKLPS
jgi:probable HAF family extracellular repeat protein